MGRDWYRLDNVGKFYSAQAGRVSQTVFRYSATMRDAVDPQALQTALERTIAVFPSFNVHLRTGFFWHYLEQADDVPAVEPENRPVCARLHYGPGSALFRVSYYRDRINLEVSHIISDGRGTLVVFKALLHEYVHERYGVEAAAAGLDGSPTQKSENSFDKYYGSHGESGEGSPKIYRMPGLRDRFHPTYVEYHADTKAVLDAAHRYGVSLTSLVIAAIMCAIRDTMPLRARSRAIKVDIPVDLRGFYRSQSVRNFFGIAFVTYMPGASDEPLETVAAGVDRQLKRAAGRDQITAYMNRMVALEKNPLLRISPTPAKDLVLELASRIVARNTTTTVSSIGRISLDAEVTPYVRELNVLTTPEGLNFMVCSFEDDLSIGISTSYADLDVIRNLCGILARIGINGTMNVGGAAAVRAGTITAGGRERGMERQPESQLEPQSETRSELQPASRSASQSASQPKARAERRSQRRMRRQSRRLEKRQAKQQEKQRRRQGSRQPAQRKGGAQ